MVSYLPDPSTIDPESRILELGPGTGVVTQCLVDRGFPEKKLVLIEYSPEFCILLRARFPTATVIEGDAYRLGESLDKHLGSCVLEGVISGLPLFTRPEEHRQDLLHASLARLKPGRPFVQFSYALVPPVRPTRVEAELETSPWIKRNLPPARVLVYRKAQR